MHPTEPTSPSRTPSAVAARDRPPARPASRESDDPTPAATVNHGRHDRPDRVLLLVERLGSRALAGDLERTGRVDVVGSSSDIVAGIESAMTLLPDVILLDRFVGLVDGLVVARRLHADLPRAAVVLRTPWPDADRHDAHRSGARDVVDITASADIVADALHLASAPDTRHTTLEGKADA